MFSPLSSSEDLPDELLPYKVRFSQLPDSPPFCLAFASSVVTDFFYDARPGSRLDFLKFAQP